MKAVDVYKRQQYTHAQPKKKPVRAPLCHTVGEKPSMARAANPAHSAAMEKYARRLWPMAAYRPTTHTASTKSSRRNDSQRLGSHAVAVCTTPYFVTAFSKNASFGNNFFQPTILVDVPANAKVSKEETFGSSCYNARVCVGNVQKNDPVVKVN